MRSIFYMVSVCVAVICMAGCAAENKKNDRSDATLLFRRSVALTQSYVRKMETVSDSLAWAGLCSEFEDSLESVNFSFPPDTDLLLTEGQNDTIHRELQRFVKVRDQRLFDILHPAAETDTVSADSITSANASRSRGN